MSDPAVDKGGHKRKQAAGSTPKPSSKRAKRARRPVGPLSLFEDPIPEPGSAGAGETDIPPPGDQGEAGSGQAAAGAPTDTATTDDSPLGSTPHSSTGGLFDEALGNGLMQIPDANTEDPVDPRLAAGLAGIPGHHGQEQGPEAVQWLPEGDTRLPHFLPMEAQREMNDADAGNILDLFEDQPEQPDRDRSTEPHQDEQRQETTNAAEAHSKPGLLFGAASPSKQSPPPSGTKRLSRRRVSGGSAPPEQPASGASEEVRRYYEEIALLTQRHAEVEAQLIQGFQVAEQRFKQALDLAQNRVTRVLKARREQFDRDVQKVQEQIASIEWHKNEVRTLKNMMAELED